MQDIELVFLRSFEMNRQQAHRGQAFMLNGREVRLYSTINLFLPLV